MGKVYFELDLGLVLLNIWPFLYESACPNFIKVRYWINLMFSSVKTLLLPLSYINTYPNSAVFYRFWKKNKYLYFVFNVNITPSEHNTYMKTYYAIKQVECGRVGCYWANDNATEHNKIWFYWRGQQWPVIVTLLFISVGRDSVCVCVYVCVCVFA